MRLHVVMLAIIKDAQGNVVQKLSEDFPVELPAERLAAVKGATLRMARPITLDPGIYVVQAVAVDREANHASTAAFRIDHSAPPGLGLSDLVLVRRVETVAAFDTTDPMQFEGRRVVPELATMLSAAAEPSVYFVIYPNPKNTAKPEITVELALDGRVLGKQTSVLPEPGKSGSIPLTLAAPAKPGKNR